MYTGLKTVLCEQKRQATMGLPFHVFYQKVQSIIGSSLSIDALASP